MNFAKLRSYREAYRKQFSDISQREIYKWQAVKTFRERWDPNAQDFERMLEESLSGTANLMDSGNYFPRRMIVRIAGRRPTETRNAFRQLFNEESDLIARIHGFRSTIDQLHKEVKIGKSHYQDQRAVMVYLCMRFPESYFLYKYDMLQDVCAALDIRYRPRPGADENLIQYLKVCQIVRNELSEDSEILVLHGRRLTTREYPDPNLTILTQDFIYAVTNYLSISGVVAKVASRIEFVNPPTNGEPPPTSFSPRFVDFVAVQRRRAQLGPLGESLVVEHEKSKVGDSNVLHMSQTKGDGAGYDIESIGNDGEKIYIEVKTTTGGPTTPFEVTRTELEFSRTHSEHYRLYRLFEFDKERNQPKCFVIEGSLLSYCNWPSSYTVYVSSPAT